METMAFKGVIRLIQLVSEGLNSVETREFRDHTVTKIHKVSEGLNSVETVYLLQSVNQTVKPFQKDLIVWKPGEAAPAI